ncbi:MAG: 5'/3'-nucleotidase SurE [Caldisphaera sp.]|jgi:5'-nucleotidase
MRNSILITNDDGIDSIGLKFLAEELNKIGFDIYVVAPKNQVSGSGKSHSFEVRVEKRDLQNAKKSWAIDGKPADAIAIAIRHLLKDVDIKLVVSGINIGPNMGLMDFFTSGTIGGALEGVLFGYKSFAVSFAILRGIKNKEQEDLLKESAKLTSIIIKDTFDIIMEDPKLDLININFPPTRPIGIKIAKISWQTNLDVYVDSNENIFHVMGWSTDDLNSAYNGGDINSDVFFVKKGYVALTPMCIKCLPDSLTYYESYEKINNALAKSNIISV